MILSSTDIVLVPTVEKEIPYIWDLLGKWHSGRLWKQMYQCQEQFNNDIKSRFNSRCDIVWTVWTKQGKASKKIGIILLSDICYGLSAEIHGVYDRDNMKGKLSDKSFKLALDFCFNNIGCARVNARFFEKNKLLIDFLSRHGFRRNAYLKKSVYINENIHDTYIYGLLEDDYLKEDKNVKTKKT